MRFRVQHDGSIILPRRGRPQKPPKGYIADTGDKFRFLPILAECKYREKRLKKSSCCGNKELDFCTDKDQYILYNICQECMGTVAIPLEAIPLEGQALYQNLYDNPNLHYGQAAYDKCPGVYFIPHYLEYLKSPIIDIGCGTGDTVRAMQKAGFVAQGMDWIDRGLNHIVCDITEPQDLSIYETTICIDVFEHITDDKLIGLVHNMQQAPRQVVTVHCGPSSKWGYNVQLHLNIKTPEQWVTYLSQYFDIVKTIHMGGVRYLYLMERLDATS